jgi:hypothetical protein
LPTSAKSTGATQTSGAGARFRIERLGAEIFPPRVSRMAILSARATRSAAASSDFDRLSAGERWIRTSGSKCQSRDRQPSREAGLLSRKRGADLVRNRRFESISLQRRVCCEPIPGSWLAPTRETPSRSCIPSRRQPTPASACWSTRFATVDENIGLEHSGMVAKTFHRRRTEMRHDLKRTLAATPSRKINHCVKKASKISSLRITYFLIRYPKS